MEMTCCRMSKQEVGFPVGIVMEDLFVHPSVIVRTSFGRDRAVARLLPTMSPASVLESIAEAVIQMTRMSKQEGGCCVWLPLAMVDRMLGAILC
ncbi:hypothetical protein AVEN_33909-1 [Araneus ventricosus]|uniref:Uncharacterized protein n=1 Tax=Araneus ventricosus TaxID=182803 RepID=A0A4Y2EI52_ARAVE|nr:hypothetical protein AVEN_33909-1 [Araneus ventricosus]